MIGFQNTKTFFAKTYTQTGHKFLLLAKLGLQFCGYPGLMS